LQVRSKLVAAWLVHTDVSVLLQEACMTDSGSFVARPSVVTTLAMAVVVLACSML
jgi:hypothetical protein